MPWKNVLLIDEDLELVAAEELDAIEHAIGCSLPTDYRTIMTTFGVGTYCGLISFTHPNEIPARTKRSREIWAEHLEFFWPQSDSVLPIDLALQSFVLATTIDGDEIILCPPAQDNLFVLPRRDEVIFTMPSGLRDPLAWKGPGPGPEASPFRYFEPFRGRGHVELLTQRTDLTTDSVYRLMLPRLSQDAEQVPRIEGDASMVAFFKGEKSKVYLMAAGDRRIRVRIEYNLRQTNAVDALILDLVSIGFKEIGRHPNSS